MRGPRAPRLAGCPHIECERKPILPHPRGVNNRWHGKRQIPISMNTFGYLLLFLIFALTAAWLVSEFKCGPGARIFFGLASGLVTCFCVCGLVGITKTFNYNTWYGENSKSLIDETVRQLEAGNTNQVLKAFKQLQENYQPTYENRAKYNLLVSNAVNSMSQPTNSPSPARQKTNSHQ
jgi:hypothetical protein